jgi:hypothetical protein
LVGSDDVSGDDVKKYEVIYVKSAKTCRNNSLLLVSKGDGNAGGGVGGELHRMSSVLEARG